MGARAERQSRFLRIEDVAELFRVSNKTIEAWVRAEKFPRPIQVTLRSPRLWDRRDVEGLIENLKIA